MIGALLPALVPILGDALKRLFPDAEARQRAEAERQREALVREVSSSAHTVAAACEQLTSSSREISTQLNDSAGLTERAVAQ